MPKITIIGRGVDPAKHLSISALKVLQKVDRIVGIESEMEFWSELQKDFKIPQVEDLRSLYRSQDKDMVNYYRFVDTVLDISSKCPHLALLVAGHPRLGVTFIDLLKAKASNNLEIEILDGISSFDVLLTHIGIDPLEQGTVLLDVNRLLLFQYRLQTELSYFIYHASSTGNSTTNFLNPSLNNRIDILKQYLLKYYSQNKELFLCKVSNGKNESSNMVRTSIKELDICIEKIDYSTTLYIPPEKPTNLDWDYLKLLGL